MGKETKPARKSASYWLLAAFVVLTFVLGGSSRADSTALVILRPVSALVCGAGLYSLTRAHYARYRLLFWLLGAVAGLCLIELVPLPPAIWQALPGRAIVTDIGDAAGMPGAWRPFAMVPYAARDALFALLVPSATLLLAAQLRCEERQALLPLVIAIGLVSGLLGILQVLGGNESSLYLRTSDYGGGAVGLFANRNHAAVFLACLFPMLAVAASRPARTVQRARFQVWLALAGGLIVLLTLIGSGSRAAVLVALPALVSVWPIYRGSVPARPSAALRRQEMRRLARGVVILGAAVVVALVARMVQRSDVLGRFLLAWTGDDLRFRVWSGIVGDAWRFFPFGSGIGSFVEVYQINEPNILLRSSYLNHAHNDVLEVVFTAGLPGLLILAVALIGWARGMAFVWKAGNGAIEGSFGQMGAVVLFLLFLASLTDYPLRTPALACFATLAAIWLVAGVRPGHEPAAGGRAASALRRVQW